MRVLCIDDKRRPADYPLTPMVKEGCIYNTTCLCDGYGADGSIALSYKLSEFPQKYCWDIDRFIPLSEISETDVNRIHSIVKEIELCN